MANSRQPLLENPNSPNPKFLRLIVSFTAIAIALTTSLIVFNRISTNPNHPFLLTPTQICNKAHNQQSCDSHLSELNTSPEKPLTNKNRVAILRSLLNNSALHLESAIETAKEVKNKVNNPREELGLSDCVELMDISMDRISSSIEELGEENHPNFENYKNAHSWLSSVLTNYMTCLDGLDETRTLFKPRLNDLISRARTALTVVASVSSSEDEITEPVIDRFPSWLTTRDRKLLESPIKEVAANADAVVAKDGSGKYKTVKEAVDAAPVNSKRRYVIYVKKGVYKEYVEIGKKKTNLMLTGDGMAATIITGSLNVVDGSTTFRSATVAAVGDGFMAQDIWFQNTAGPQKHQAVALRVGADQSVINRCRIDAYQDTLYTHSLRQFYRDCYITGTVDFIFGNAAVVFQSCKIVARKPMNGQSNMVTAQGREDPNQNTGTSIQKCDVIASSDLEPVKGSIKTYLGRPWKAYSRTVIMQSNIGDHIDPTGWSPWTGDFALKTLYYGEYANRGSGSGTSKRVKWAGYHVITNPKEAEPFTVAQLIQGGIWLKNTGVTYQEWL